MENMKRKIEEDETSNKKINIEKEYIVFSGDRNWNKEKDSLDTVIKVLNELDSKKHILVHGGCKGLDLMVDKESKRLNFKVISCSADWKKDGKKAGPIRNSTMLKDYNPRIVYCFHNNIENSKGTKDMVNKCKLREKKLKKEHEDNCKDVRFNDCIKHSFQYKLIKSI